MCYDFDNVIIFTLIFTKIDANVNYIKKCLWFWMLLNDVCNLCKMLGKQIFEQSREPTEVRHYAVYQLGGMLRLGKI